MKPLCVVVGVGPGNGAAFARRFASEGYAVALLARTTDFAAKLADSLPDARAYPCDVADASLVAGAFDAVRRDFADPEVLLYNAGSGVWGSVEEATAADFESAWRVNALGGFLASKQVIPAMKRAGRGSIVFVGATASRKAGARSAAFLLRQGRATKPGRVDGARPLASRHPRVSHRHRRCRGPAEDEGADAGQARLVLHQAGRRGGDRLPPHPAAPVGMVVRGGSAAVPGELVVQSALRGSAPKQDLPL